MYEKKKFISDQIKSLKNGGELIKVSHPILRHFAAFSFKKILNSVLYS